MESIFDLPAHPLMVHFPVVAIPLLSLVAIVLVARPSMRSSWRWFAISFGIVTAVATILAASSGEALVELLDNEDFVETHQSLGETLRIFVVGLAASLIALVLLARDEAAARRRLGAGLGAITILFALLSIVWTVRTGHEGAKLTWGGVDLSVEDEDEEQEDEEKEEEKEAEDGEDQALPVVDPPEETAAPEVTSTTTTSTTSTTSTAAPATSAVAVGALDGMQLFEANCSRCHGSNGAGTRGPSLIGIAAENPEVQTEINQIINGGERMPSFGDKLSEREILAIVGYYRATFVEPGA